MLKYIIAKKYKNILYITKYVLKKRRKLKPKLKPKQYQTRHLSVFDFVLFNIIIIIIIFIY